MSRFKKASRTALPSYINGYSYAEWCKDTGLGILHVPVDEGARAWIAGKDPKKWAFDRAFDRYVESRTR